MDAEFFVRVALGLIMICGAFITAFVVPCLRTWIGSENLEQLQYYVAIAVRCAEQMFTADQWKEKKEWVFAYVKGLVDTTLKIKITDDDINTIIEAVVNEIKHDAKYQVVSEDK